ncbi:MAG: ABC transporter permease [Gammaproteobacteria bacterium]|nr:ABC transporter permease subunit [Gammaproteobacteria bacterium]NNC96973.1 ABC transporter permease [Gammaproteobacteria bacterium]NNM13418.1 ABC transporter permease [Gammaproteobacteria bacterium]
MKQIYSITKKEIQDNIRDKRSLGFALIYPIAFPLYLAFVFFITVSVTSVDFEKESDLHVAGQELAPNLITYLQQNNFNILAAPENFSDKVKNLEIPVVLEIKASYGEKLREGLPAPLKVYMTESDNDSDKAANKIRTVLNRYARTLNQQRLLVRGIDVNLFDSINVEKEDVSSEGTSGRAQGLMVPMAIIISMIMGAFYLAIEVTAGEKEKHTLEPLMTLPVSRNKMVLGKFFALLAFCLFSMFVAIISFVVVFELIPSDKIPDIFNFNMELVTKISLILIPLAAFISALLMVISSFTKSTKEAQTYLGFSIFLFFAPFFVMMWKTIPAIPSVVASPIVSQYKLLDMVFKDETISTSNMLLSTSSTFASAGLLLLLAFWLYKQDRILQ